MDFHLKTGITGRVWLTAFIFTAFTILAAGFGCYGQDSRAVRINTSGSGMGSTNELRVAGAVIPVSADIDSNILAIKRAIDFAEKEHADILLTPEGSLSGYTSSFDREKVEAGLADVTTYARAAKIGLALGICMYEPGYDRPFDQIRFYTKEGDYLGFHSKILRCTNIKNPSPGNEEMDLYETCELKIFKINDIPVGGLVCNDLWATPDWTSMPDPHLTQQLSERGARIIFHAANTGADKDEWGEVYREYHNANLQIRARTGKIWIVTVDASPGNKQRSQHRSGVIDPSGSWVISAVDKGEQYFAFTIHDL